MSRIAALSTFLFEAARVRKIARRGVFSMLVELIELKRAIGLSGPEYFLYELYRDALAKEQKREYLTRLLHEKYLAPLDPPAYSGLLRDKFVAHRHFAASGLRMPRLLGLVHPLTGHTDTGLPLKTPAQLRAWLPEVADNGIVVKPAVGGVGAGVLVFRGACSLRPFVLQHVNGRLYDAGELHRILFSSAARTHAGFIVEQRVEQHPYLTRFNASTLNTIRVVTLRGDDGALRLLGAALKLGLDNSGVESEAREHLVVPVDCDTGMLGRGAFRRGLVFERTGRHPATGIPFEGEALPAWPEIRRMALMAAEAALRIRSIGWDIGLAKDGPVLIEGNEIWGEEILQLAYGRGLWTPALRDAIGAPAYLA